MEELLSNFTKKELMMYRIAITNSKDPDKVDNEFYFQFVIRKEEWEKTKEMEHGSI